MKIEEVQNALGSHADVLEVKRLIGCGSFGSVWLASDRTLGGRQVALKVLDRLNDYEGVKAYAGGVKQHPNLLQIFFCDICAEKLFYAMELADNVAEDDGDYRADTLAGRLVSHAAAGTRLSTDEIRSVILGLLDGLATMHSCGYCHRDIKPENIIFVAGVPKLSDVGSVRRIAEANTSGVTPCYMPPEMCEGKYDPIGHDLYSIGMLIYCMLALRGGDDYPILDDLELLQDKTCQRLNAFVTEYACSDDADLRYHEIDDFRADFERCFYRFPIAKLTTGGIFLVTVLSLIGWGLYEHFAPEIKRTLTFSTSSAYVKFPNGELPQIEVSLSDEFRREDLPLECTLPEIRPNTVLRIASTKANAIPERLQKDVYGSWDNWNWQESALCTIEFLRGRSASVTMSGMANSSDDRNFLLSDLFDGNSRNAVLKISAADAAGGVDIMLNDHLIATDFFKAESDPVRLLIGEKMEVRSE